MGLITFTPEGLYCAAGGFYIDPWKPVHRAIITHAHSDHSRWGMKHYLAHDDSRPFMKARLGEDIDLETMPYGEPRKIGDVTVSFHSAAHIIGSAMLRIEHCGEVWVVSGDYKIEDDGISGPFEPVRCHTFITESTFGLPIYKWKSQPEIMENIHQWIQANQAKGRNSVLTAYSLGKSQRLVHSLSQYGYPIYGHGATYNMHQACLQVRPGMPQITYLNKETSKDAVRDGVIICPGSAVDTPWMRRWQPYALGVCSGWMQVRGAQRRRNADAGFPLSDHADWPGLLTAIEASGAECVYATHGFSSVLARYLKEERGIKADVVKTSFGEDEEEN
jgi:putative mRNA 3-end processing factor